jgi:hypothetical protein
MPSENDASSQTPWYKRLGCVIPLFIFLGVAIYVGNGLMEAERQSKLPTYFKNGADFPLDDLPPSARDVHFRYSGGGEPWGTAYEFQCTEEDFREWAAKARVKYPKLSVIRKESSYVLPVILSDATVDATTANDVLVSDWQYTDQGHYFVYDRDRGRAITWSMSR